MFILEEEMYGRIYIQRQGVKQFVHYIIYREVVLRVSIIGSSTVHKYLNVVLFGEHRGDSI